MKGNNDWNAVPQNWWCRYNFWWFRSPTFETHSKIHEANARIKIPSHHVQKSQQSDWQKLWTSNHKSGNSSPLKTGGAIRNPEMRSMHNQNSNSRVPNKPMLRLYHLPFGGGRYYFISNGRAERFSFPQQKSLNDVQPEIPQPIQSLKCGWWDSFPWKCPQCEKSFAPIVQKNHRVDGANEYQKTDEEQAGKRHEHFYRANFLNSWMNHSYWLVRFEDLLNSK